MKSESFECLDQLDADQTEPDVLFEPVDAPSVKTELDEEGEIAAFVKRPDKASESEADRPAKPAKRSTAASQSTPLGDLMGFYRGGR